MKIKVTETYDVDIPEIPRHFRATGGKRASIPISELPPQVLSQIGEEWTRKLIAAAYPELEEQDAETRTE